MRYTYFLFALTILFLSSFELHAQARSESSFPNVDDIPDHVRGELFFKIDEESDVDLNAFHKGKKGKEALEGTPLLKELISPYEIERIYCPFRTQAPEIQHTYKLLFEDNDKEATEELIGKLASLPYVDYAERVAMYRASFTPDDVAAEQQWYLDSISAKMAWDASKGGSSDIEVAVVDDAVHISHPDLQGNIATNNAEIPGDSIDNDNNGYIDDVNGWDAADQDNDPEPPDSHPLYGFGPIFTHGTHTSGIVSAVTNNGKGVAGTGFNASIIPIKATENTNNFPIAIDAFAEGVDYAISAEPDIISMSLGGQKNNTVINLLEQAHNDSIVLVAASGNNGSSDTTWPAGMEEVIGVGSTTHGDTVSDFSNYGTWVDLMAPGDSIYSTLWEGSSQSSTYGKQAGTSMACPLVSGIASLMMAADTGATPSEIRACLKNGSKKIDSINPSYIDSMGAGRVNAYQSLLCLDASLKDSTYTDTSSGGDTNTSVLDRRSEAASAFTVFPNPTRGELRWEAPKGFQPQSVDIQGLRGRSLREIEIASDRKGVIQLNELPEGLYLLRFQDDNGQEAIKKVSISR